MKIFDIIFAAACGLAVAWIALDFFSRSGWIFFIVLPILSIIGLWLVELLGKRFLFIGQAGRFVLSGAFADVIDIKVFQFLFWLAPFPLFFKSASFLLATSIKYLANKNWSFGKQEVCGFLPYGKKPHTPKPYTLGVDKEIGQFLLVTLLGLGLNVVSFYYFGKIETGLPSHIWQEISIILAALMTAVWNFCGYKFIVFKK